MVANPPASGTWAQQQFEQAGGGLLVVDGELCTGVGHGRGAQEDGAAGVVDLPHSRAGEAARAVVGGRAPFSSESHFITTVPEAMIVVVEFEGVLWPEPRLPGAVGECGVFAPLVDSR